jgi:hypothetical protein
MVCFAVAGLRLVVEKQQAVGCGLSQAPRNPVHELCEGQDLPQWPIQFPPGQGLDLPLQPGVEAS